MTVVPLRMVKVAVPSLTVPAVLVTVALRLTSWAEVLKVALAFAAVTVVPRLEVVAEGDPADRLVACHADEVGLIIGSRREGEIVDDAAAEGNAGDGLGKAAEGHEVIRIVMRGRRIAVHRAEDAAIRPVGGGGAAGEPKPINVKERNGADGLAEIDFRIAAAGVVGQIARGTQGGRARGENGSAGEAGALEGEGRDAGPGDARLGPGTVEVDGRRHRRRRRIRLDGPRRGDFADDIGAGHQTREGKLPGRIVGLCHHVGIQRVEDAAVVEIEINEHTGLTRFTAVLDAVAVEVVEGQARDGAGQRVQVRIVEHGRSGGVLEVVQNFGRDLRQVRSCPRSC